MRETYVCKVFIEIGNIICHEIIVALNINFITECYLIKNYETLQIFCYNYNYFHVW